MEDMEQINDIPEGVARIEALDNALKTASEGEDETRILARANLYYKFLTENRTSYQAFQPDPAIN